MPNAVACKAKFLCKIYLTSVGIRFGLFGRVDLCMYTYEFDEFCGVYFIFY